MNTKRRARSQAGFTLVELLVTLAIILIITLISRSGKVAYERSLFLTNLAYDVALTIRQAQVYGADVRQSSSGSNQFDVGYGVYFQMSDPTHFVLFEDRDNDHAYVQGVGFDGDPLQTFTISGNNFISSLCAVNGSGTCVPSSSLSITFRRPESTACINAGGVYPSARSTAACTAATGNTEGRIVLSPENRDPSDSNSKTVFVLSTGQISVQ